jgi:hypothetical protein
MNIKIMQESSAGGAFQLPLRSGSQVEGRCLTTGTASNPFWRDFQALKTSVGMAWRVVANL